MDVVVNHRKILYVVSMLTLSAMWRQNPDKLDYWIDCNRLSLSYFLDASQENHINLIIFPEQVSEIVW